MRSRSVFIFRKGIKKEDGSLTSNEILISDCDYNNILNVICNIKSGINIRNAMQMFNKSKLSIGFPQITFHLYVLIGYNPWKARCYHDVTEH